ncbi:MAG: hypothetical protein H7A25_01175 [Leptospiraceae bacterium]|nr:hypothetical protein [Leptospiraceae bacterium]MCP5498487.1 hypothetical protein [Leptospiraceae bacterium]
MQHYEVEAAVAEGTLTAKLPEAIEPGTYRIVVVFEDITTPAVGTEHDLSQEHDLSIRLKRMEENPHPGFTREEVERDLEALNA